jgi:membrane protein implicated in regulation of membrane protease activity
MLRILLALLITTEILLVPLMIFCLSGINILLPGLGLVIGGGVIFVFLLFAELILLAITFVLYRQWRRNSEKLD